ncbi:MAG TPA: PAS domain S-box protein [Nocardioides sp.]|nr:PAS domain S-box protein [Nocardioides sp.]
MESQTQLADTGDLWRLAMERSPIGMALVSPAGEFLRVNAALCDMLGYEPEELRSRTVHEVTHPDDADADRSLAMDVLEGRIDSFRVAKRYLRSDGSVMSGELTLTLVRDAHGQPVHFVSQVLDLSERRAFVERLDAAEAAVDDVQRKGQALFESVSVGLLLVDADGTYSAYNRRLREFLSLAFPDGHLGHAGQTGFVFDADQQRALTDEEVPCRRALAGNDFDDLLIWIGEHPGARRALSVSARSVRDRSGALTGAVLAYHDVTELIGARKVKDDFVATVSHELRTPLAAALANLELLDDADGVGPEAQLQVAAARRNMLRLSHLVADLLFTATATSGLQVIDPFRVDLTRVVGEAVEAAGLQAEAAEIDLRAELPDALDVVADGFRVRQVADNLIANALAYTPPGGRVTVTLSGSERHAEIVVADTGEGIEAADLDVVFAAFVRGQNARRRLAPGTGLGLTIVRTIVEAHGGEVSAQSAPGEGTTVRVVLPR